MAELLDHYSSIYDLGTSNHVLWKEILAIYSNQSSNVREQSLFIAGGVANGGGQNFSACPGIKMGFDQKV